jgi:hypothetical protein
MTTSCGVVSGKFECLVHDRPFRRTTKLRLASGVTQTAFASTHLFNRALGLGWGGRPNSATDPIWPERPGAATSRIGCCWAERPYTLPFSGHISAQHAGEVASAFIKAVSDERTGAQVFGLNGRPTSVAAWLDIIRELAPGARLDVKGDPLPFPADLSDAPIRDYLGDYGPVPLEEGIEATYAAFRRLLAAGALSPAAVA